jgi:flagellar basal body rod protein FlgB
MLQSSKENILYGLLNAAGERQTLIANNIANARVEGYQARDVDFDIVMHDLRAGNTNIKATLAKATTKNEGSPVILEEEMSKMYKNHVTYVLLTRINGQFYKNMEEATQAARAG